MSWGETVGQENLSGPGKAAPHKVICVLYYVLLLGPILVIALMLNS